MAFMSNAVSAFHEGAYRVAAQFDPANAGSLINQHDTIMAIRYLKAKFTGINPLLQNNPQTVDRFNTYSKAMAKINAKKTRRTDDDYLELRNLEMRAKVYWDDAMGIYVPATWVTAAIAGSAFRTVKVSKADVRSAVFANEQKLELSYRDKAKVKAPDDIVKNPAFRLDMTLKQGQVRVVKAVPIFHDWSFQAGIEYDDSVIDADSMNTVITRVAHYGGFGDFRPTFGRAQVEITHE